MKVSFKHPVDYKRVNNLSSFSCKNKLERSPSTDSISFVGNKNRNKVLSPRIQTAVDYSQDILSKFQETQLTLKDVFEITSKYIDDVTIYPISKLGEIIPNPDDYSAFAYAHMNQDCKADSKKMYVNIPNGNPDNIKKALFAMDSAHEFAHIEQYEAQEAFEMLKLLAKGDYKYACAIMVFANSAFNYLDTQVQAQIVAPIMKQRVSKKELDKYNHILPKEMNITSQMLPKAVGLKQEDELKQQLRNVFNNYFQQILFSVSKNNPEIMEMIPEDETYENLFEKVKTCCIKKAMEEKEAYLVESEVAKKIMKTHKSLNIDTFPMYYGLLAEALSE